MDLQRRRIDPDIDKGLILSLHCMGNYASDTPWARRIPYDQYEPEWLATPQPEMFFADLKASLKDDRTVADFWCDGAQCVVGFLWMTFAQIDGYGLVVAELRDIAVVPEYRRRGVGTAMLRCAEESARSRGAHLFRSETGVENAASQALHEKAGFEIYRIQYEKVLDPVALQGKGPSPRASQEEP